MEKLLFSVGFLLTLADILFLGTHGSVQAQRHGSRLVELASVSVPSATTAATGITVHPAGLHTRLRNRVTLVVTTTKGTASTDYYGLPTAYYQFLFNSNSNPSEGAIVNFLDTTGTLKASMHLSSTNKLLFYDSTGTLQATGTTTLSNGTTYTLGAKIGTGNPGAWEFRINGNLEISGSNNVGTNNNGSTLLGGSGSYTDTYYYDNVSISSNGYAAGMFNYVDFETGDLTQAVTSTNATVTNLVQLAGKYSLVLQRNASVANYEIRASPYSIYFQHSADDGQTWNDMAKVCAYNGTIYVPISAIAKGPTSSLTTISDGALSDNTAVQGPIGDLLRVKYDARNTKGGFTFHAYYHAH